MPAAEFAAALKLRVAVVERHRVGGDCLWTGCVPSKALLASAKVAHHIRTAAHYGLPAIAVPAIDTKPVWDRIKAVQQQIADTDDAPDRYRDLGIELILGRGHLVDGTTVEVTAADGAVRTISARYILVCTGSRPARIPLPGLEGAGYLTSETFFELDRAPESLVVIGGGPIAIELSQALHRLGVPVTVLQKGPAILVRDEPELASRLTDLLVAEGLDLRLQVETERVEVLPDGRKAVYGTEGGEPRRWEAAELFVGAGRTPNTEGLGLEALGIEVTRKGVGCDNRMRTAVETVYVSGDVAGRSLFTHSAAYEGVRAVRDMFFPGKGVADATIPWCTFTDPELAHVGMTSAEAIEAHGDKDVHVWKMDMAHSDRARADGADAGAVIVVTGAKNVILGAHILGPAAGEMIHELVLAESRGLRINDLATVVHVYPTLSTSIAQLAAESAYEYGARMRRLTRFLTP